MKRLLIILSLLVVPQCTWAKPNVLVVVTDDLDWLTYDTTPGLTEIAAQGMTFNAVTSTPLCGPSRASMLTGKHTHNHGVKGNDKQNFNDDWYENVLGNTFADWCQDDGYHTIMSGKYANPFDKIDKTGWSTWIYPEGRGDPVLDSSEFWHTRLINNTINDIEQNQDKPIVVWYSSTIPHGPLTVDPMYAGSMGELTVPQVGSFNEEDISDKVGEASLLPLLTEIDIENINRRFTLRVEMMRSVVDGINQLIDSLSNRPLYVIFISDNGYLQGQHRFRRGKGQPYEESVRVPMFIIGPGVQSNTFSPAMVYAADIAPTVGELCGASSVPETDAKSLVPLFDNPNLQWRNRVLLEHGWNAILTPARKLIHFNNGQSELYRFATDPAEMTNVYSPASSVSSLESYLNRLMTCSGSECWQIESE